MVEEAKTAETELSTSSRGGDAVRPGLPLALFHHQRRKDGGRGSILVHEKKLSSLQLLPILEAAVQTAKPLLLVAEDIERRRHRSGGGAALLRAQAVVGKLKDDNPDIQSGINLVLRAIEAPIRQIVENAGAEGSVVVGKILERQVADLRLRRPDCNMSTW